MKIASRLGGFDESFAHTQDYDFWLRAFEDGVRFDFCRESLTIGRIHDTQGSKDSGALIEIEKILRRIVDTWLFQESALKKSLNGVFSDDFTRFQAFLEENSYFSARDYLLQSRES